MQLGCGFQYSLVMFYNPNPTTMASFTAPAHEEPNSRGAGPGRAWALRPGRCLGMLIRARLWWTQPLAQSSPALHTRAVAFAKQLVWGKTVIKPKSRDESFGVGPPLSCAVWGRWLNLSEFECL